MTKEITIADKNNVAISSFELTQRKAQAYSKSTLVPKEYQNNIPNCMIALEIAERVGFSPTMVMQNLYIVHNRPAWSSQFIIAAINSCGRFKPLKFDVSGTGDDYGCIAWTEDKENRRLESSRITIGMAKKEGWYDKNGSKWKTMPDQMLRYRAASFLGRIYAPEILMGMYTVEEVESFDPQPINVTPTAKTSPLSDIIDKAKEIVEEDNKSMENNQGSDEAESVQPE